MLKAKAKKDKKGKIDKSFLEGSSSESETEKDISKSSNKKKDELSINKDYATKYDNWRNLEEMQRLKDRLGVSDINELKEDDSSSESSSEDDEEWSTEKEKAFLKTLSCLKKKDPKIYTDKFGFFKGVDESIADESKGAVEAKKSKKEKKPFTVRDHERVMALQNGGLSDDDEYEYDQNSKSEPLSYSEELASIRTEFSNILNDSDSSDDEEKNSLLGSKLLKKRVNKSEADEQREKEEYKLWLKGELDRVDKKKLSKEDKKELKCLREYWNDDKLDEGEKFLRDYILNKKHMEPLKEDKSYIPSYNEVVHDDDELSDDEKFEAEREEFEHKYNFRFEEPDQDFIKRYPRTIQDSLRREEHKRKDQREKTKGRKEDAKSKKREEVQRLKAHKRKEIMDKIQKLHDISGNPDLDLTEVDIEGDFDPEEYDRRMQQLFSDNYYEECGEDDEKPVFEYDEEIDDEENFNEWVPSKNASTPDEDDDSKSDNSEAEVSKRESIKQSRQQELIEASKGKRGKKKRSIFLDVLEKNKPKFDPDVHKSYEKYFDEYYKLNFEDLVGDLPTRFKYHKTTPNDFGLSVDEILNAPDKELNQWASLKKAIQYREVNEEQYEVQAYKKKSERQDLKRRILPSMYQSQEVETQGDDDEQEVNEQQKKKRKKKNKKKTKTNSISEANEEFGETDNDNMKSAKQLDKVDKQSSKKTKNSSISKEDFGETDNIQSVKRRDKVDTKKTSNMVSNGSKQPSADEVSQSFSEPTEAKLSKRQRKNRKKLGIVSESSPQAGQTKTDSVKSQNLQLEKGSGERINKKHTDKLKGVKRKAPESNDPNNIGVDDDRLKAYGINPTKFKKRLKYGASFAKS